MKKIISTAILFALVASSGALASEKFGWNPEKGKKLYISKVKKQLCHKMDVKKFTQTHTQKQWQEMIKNGTFEAELSLICPSFVDNTFTEAEISSLGDAVVNYASDSYNIPS